MSLHRKKNSMYGKLKYRLKLIWAVLRGDFVLAVAIDQRHEEAQVGSFYVGRAPVANTMLAAVALKNMVNTLELGITQEMRTSTDVFALEGLRRAAEDWGRNQYGSDYYGN